SPLLQDQGGGSGGCGTAGHEPYLSSQHIGAGTGVGRCAVAGGRKMNKTRLLSPSAFAGLALLIVITIVGYALVPAGTEMPVHWGPDGAADAYLLRDWALLMPLVVVAVLAVVFRIAIERGPEGERAAAGLRTAFAGLALLMAAIQAG